jgi:hypothetical protein
VSEIRCGQEGCGQAASTQAVVEMANLTGGMMGGLFSNSRDYRCPTGHVTTRSTAFGRLRGWLKANARQERK